MSGPPDTRAEDDRRYHTYRTHHIPWYIYAMWIAFLVGAVWYVAKYAIPMAKNYF